jgi:hypothetical protein
MSAGGSTPKACHLQEHDQLLWQVLEDKLQGPFEIVNVDAHSDLAMFKGQLDIGNFISKMVDLGLVNRALWVRANGSIDFADGNYSFAIGRTGHGLRLGSSLPAPFCFLNEDYVDRALLYKPKELALSVVTDLSRPVFSDNKWILSVDYDYFGCRNPNSDDLKRLIDSIGAQTISALYAKGSMIQSWTEWLEFKATIDKMAPGVFAEIVRCLLPNFTLSEEDIMGKVVELSSFIHKSRDIKNCLGVYLIDSMSSGFTDPSKYETIDRCVKAWIGSLLKR